MADIAKKYVDLTQLGYYNGKIKGWANSENQVAFKTVLKSGDGNSLLFFKKPNATLSDEANADATIPLGNADASTKLTALGTFVGATYSDANKTWSFTGLDESFDATTVVAALNELHTDISAVANDLKNLDTRVGKVPTGATATTVVGYAAEVANAAEQNAKDYTDDKIEALDTASDVTIASKSGKAVTIAAGISETDGVIGAGSGTAITLADVASTGAAEDVTTTAITDGKAEPTQIYAAGNVQGILEAIARNLNNLKTQSAVTVEKQATAETGFFATYVIKQNNAQVGEKINIPKDYLVKSATVETVTVADKPYTGAEVGDKYIDFVINTRDTTETAEHLYLPLDALMAAISGGTNAEATVSIDAHNVITVTINKIAASKIAYSNTTSGSAVEETVQDALARIDGDATTAGSINKAKADVIGTNADAKTADTVYGAKAYADDKVTNLNTASDVAIATVNETTGVITITGSVKETSGVIGAGTADAITITPITNSEIDALFT